MTDKHLLPEMKLNVSVLYEIKMWFSSFLAYSTLRNWLEWWCLGLQISPHQQTGQTTVSHIQRTFKSMLKKLIKITKAMGG